MCVCARACGCMRVCVRACKSLKKHVVANSALCVDTVNGRDASKTKTKNTL